ncbi:hypothetical protein [Shimia sp. MMG029]|nr:hypothetical protein [Shimia sp. MMG029]MDA5555380.1 hypothetical protein [Shimia sp. MMG029]
MLDVKASKHRIAFSQTRQSDVGIASGNQNFADSTPVVVCQPHI